MNDPCPYCGYSVTIPLLNITPAARREHYEKAKKIWELMGEIFSTRQSHDIESECKTGGQR